MRLPVAREAVERSPSPARLLPALPPTCFKQRLPHFVELLEIKMRAYHQRYTISFRRPSRAALRYHAEALILGDEPYRRDHGLWLLGRSSSALRSKVNCGVGYADSACRECIDCRPFERLEVIGTFGTPRLFWLHAMVLASDDGAEGSFYFICRP